MRRFSLRYSIRLALLAHLLTLSFVSGVSQNLFALPWTSNDGKTIEADFVRVVGDTVFLRKGERKYKIPLKRLSADSQGFAAFMQHRRKEWVAANATSPIIIEQILQEITAFDSSATEGKSYLVEGHVGEIRKTGGALARNQSSKVEATLRGGTVVTIDFAEKVDGLRTKMKIESDQVVLLKARTTGASYENYTPDGFLLQVGQAVVVRATVKKGAIVGTGLASSAEVTEARLLFAKQNGGLALGEVMELERLKNRAEFLEAQLKGNAGTATIQGLTGTAGWIVMEYSEAEKEAMRKELELIRAEIAAATK